MLFRSVLRALQVLLYVGLQATAGLASDLTIKSSQSESLEANDNYFMLPAPKGIMYAPLSSASLDVLARTPTTRYDLHGDVSYYHFFGPGAADAAAPTVKQDGVNFNLEHDVNTAGDEVSVTASSRQQDVATAQLNDIGVVTAGGQVTTSAIGGNLNRHLTAIDSLVLSATSTRADFTSSSEVPYVNLTTAAVWTRRVTPTTDLIATTGLDWTIQDNQARQDTKFWHAEAEARMRPTSRLSLSGSIGVGLITVSQDGTASVVAPSPLPTPGSFTSLAGTGSSVGLLTDAQAVYKLRKTTELSATASRSIAPDVLGHLSARKSYQIGLTQTINSVSSLSLAGALNEITASQTGSGLSGPSNFWTANVTYARQLTPEWRTQVAYNYRRNESEGTSVSSNALVLTLAHDMIVRP